MAKNPPHSRVLVIGAGPAGLTAAYLLAKEGKDVCVLEADPKYVGGISRTIDYKGFLFDIGGHRFFSKSQRVNRLWHEILGKDLQIRERSSKIYFRGKYFSYPLLPLEALKKLGIWESTLCVLSYLRARLRPIPDPKNFTDWVTNRFGYRLFELFFRTYTEKVWGMPCEDISADWAVQRINDFSLRVAIKSALQNIFARGPVTEKPLSKTLLNRFLYPRRGPGMMWEACASRIRSFGGRVELGCRLVDLRYDKKTALWFATCVTREGKQEIYEGFSVISSAPLRELASFPSLDLAKTTRFAAQQLRYRDFITVGLIVRDRKTVTANWIYVHDPAVSVGRIQNYKSWSAEMVPDAMMANFGMEYFCFENDALWNQTDQQWIALARTELVTLGLVRSEDVIDGCVIRQPKAYPVYDECYQETVEEIRKELEARFPSLYVVGRNGMHKYNNQDHSMMTAMLTVDNILAGYRRFDVWKVNQDAEYSESGEFQERGRAVPRRIVRDSTNEKLGTPKRRRA